MTVILVFSVPQCLRSESSVKCNTMRIAARKFLFCISLLTLTLISITALAEQPWSKRMADSVMARWPDGQIVRGTDKIGDWAYDKNILLAGFAALWANTADPAYYRYIQRSMDRLVTPDGAIPSYKPDDLSLDEVALGRELLLLYGRTRKLQYYKAATTIRHQLEVQPRTRSKGFWHKK